MHENVVQSIFKAVDEGRFTQEQAVKVVCAYHEALVTQNPEVLDRAFVAMGLPTEEEVI